MMGEFERAKVDSNKKGELERANALSRNTISPSP
jgi:hypothetical protein